MKLYLINTYESQMASEQGITATLHEPTNTLYYKSEILEEVDVPLPDGFLQGNPNIGYPEDIYFFNEAAEMVTELRNGRYVTSLVVSEGIFKWHVWKWPLKNGDISWRHL